MRISAPGATTSKSKFIQSPTKKKIMFNIFKKNKTEKKQKSIDEIVGMADNLIGMVTMGKDNLGSLFADYMPKLIDGVKVLQGKMGAKAMLVACLDPTDSHLVVSLYKVQGENNLELFKSCEVRSLPDVIAFIKQQEIEYATPAPEPNAADQSDTTNDGAGTEPATATGSGQ
jgi:hypothetical protein